MTTRPIVIRFFAPVIDVTVNALINAVDQKMKQGITELTLLISSPGGSVHHGLSAYNYLKGIPVNVTTHNFGSVDSIGVIVFCGGNNRLSVPEARFLLHGVSSTFQNERLEEKQLEERLKGLQNNVENIAKVIAANTNKSVQDIRDAILDRTILNPEEAKVWGLVNEIKAELFGVGSEVIPIQYQQPNQSQASAE